MLIGGGIGVTPLLSRYRTAKLDSSIKKTFFFQTAKNEKELIYHVASGLTSDLNSRLHYFCSVTRENIWEGRKTRFTAEDILSELDSTRSGFHFLYVIPVQ